MIDLGMHHGQHFFYVDGKSLLELVEEGLVIAIPCGGGIVFKRPEVATPLEKMSAFSLDELRKMAGRSPYAPNQK